MAKVDEDLDLDVEGGKGAKGGGKMKSIIIFSLIGVLLIGFSITLTLLLVGGDDPAPAAQAPAQTATTPAANQAAPQAAEDGEEIQGGADSAYMTLDPAFVVNLDGTESDIRYLQISVSVMVNGESNLEVVKKHMPVIRHNLNLLFSSLDFNDIRNREGKKKLTEESLKVVQSALKKVSGKPTVQAVFFNSIVGQ